MPNCHAKITNTSFSSPMGWDLRWGLVLPSIKSLNKITLQWH